MITLSLFGAMASSSSMKMIAGAFFSASSNAVLKNTIFKALTVNYKPWASTTTLG